MLLIPHLSGCFQFVPVPSGSIRSGAEITLGFTERGQEALAQSAGPGAQRISGNVVSSTDTSLVISVKEVEHVDMSYPVRWAGEPLEISHDWVSGYRVRRLSRSRTALVTVLVAAGAVATSLITITASGGGDPGPDAPPGNPDPD